MSVNDSQTFQLDVFNNTKQTLFIQITGNLFIVGAQGSWTLSPSAWLSAQNGNVPWPLTLNDNPVGSLNYAVQLVTNGSPSGPQGNYILEFDGTNLENFPGIACYGNPGDLDDDPLKTTVGYIFPLLYMDEVWNGGPLVVLMLVEAAGASADLSTPVYS